jgi:uncharacterized protein YlzI (FlbEa/FlbD family)
MTLTELNGQPLYVRATAINLVRAPLPSEFGEDAKAVIAIGADKIAVREMAESIATLIGLKDKPLT